MANKTFPSLPEITAIDENTLFAVDSGTQTFKAPADKVADYIAGRAESAAKTLLKKMVISNWEEVGSFATRGTDFPNTIKSIAFNPSNGRAVAVSKNKDSSNRSLLTSTGALKTWQMSGALLNHTWQRVIFVPEVSNRFYIVGSENSTGNGKVAWSTDGTAYSALTSALGSKPLYDICYSPALNRFLAVTPATDGTAAMISNDGTTWTTVSTPPGLGFNSCAWSPALNKFVMGGWAQMAWSDDGINWEAVTIPELSSTAINKVIWVGGDINLFIAGAYDATILTSADGEVWTLRTQETPTGIYFDDIAYSPSLKLIVGVTYAPTPARAGRIYFSENGTTWEWIQNLPNPDSEVYSAITWIENQKRFLIGASFNLTSMLIGKSLAHPNLG